MKAISIDDCLETGSYPEPRGHEDSPTGGFSNDFVDFRALRDKLSALLRARSENTQQN